MELEIHQTQVSKVQKFGSISHTSQLLTVRSNRVWEIQVCHRQGWWNIRAFSHIMLSTVKWSLVFWRAECLYLHLHVKHSEKWGISDRQFQYQSLSARMHQMLTMQPYWTQLNAKHKIITMHHISLANFTAAEFNKIFLGRQPRQGVKFLQNFRDRFHLESVPETLENFHTLMQLSAWEDFIKPCILI
jgi:hypothetical protein